MAGDDQRRAADQHHVEEIGVLVGQVGREGGTQMWLSKVTIQVWPSGAALAAAVAPITPAAPGLFSTTTFQPVFSVSLAWMMRAIGSVRRPAGTAR